MRDALACILYQIAQEIKPLLLIFGTAPLRKLILTVMVGMRIRGYGLSSLSGVRTGNRTIEKRRTDNESKND